MREDILYDALSIHERINLRSKYPGNRRMKYCNSKHRTGMGDCSQPCYLTNYYANWKKKDMDKK